MLTHARTQALCRNSMCSEDSSYFFLCCVFRFKCTRFPHLRTYFGAKHGRSIDLVLKSLCICKSLSLIIKSTSHRTYESNEMEWNRAINNICIISTPSMNEKWQIYWSRLTGVWLGSMTSSISASRYCFCPWGSSTINAHRGHMFVPIKVIRESKLRPC